MNNSKLFNKYAEALKTANSQLQLWDVETDFKKSFFNGEISLSQKDALMKLYDKKICKLPSTAF